MLTAQAPDRVTTGADTTPLLSRSPGPFAPSGIDLLPMVMAYATGDLSGGRHQPVAEVTFLAPHPTTGESAWCINSFAGKPNSTNNEEVLP
jgi:hypothetical protein